MSFPAFPIKRREPAAPVRGGDRDFHNFRQNPTLCKMSLHHSAYPTLHCTLNTDIPRRPAARDARRSPPPRARIVPQGYTEQLSILLGRLETQTVHELEADLQAGRLSWALHECLGVPLCPCNVCTEYGKHLVWALSGLPKLRGEEIKWEEISEEISKRNKFESEYRAEKKKSDEEDGGSEKDSDDEDDEGSEEDSDDEDLNQPPKPELMGKLYELKDALARKSAYEGDMENPVARARYEGVLVKIYSDKMDALRERDDAIKRSAILEAKLKDLEAVLAEKHNLLEIVQRDFESTKLQLGQLRLVQPTVEALVEKMTVLTARETDISRSHHAELTQKVAALSDLEQRHQDLQSRHQDVIRQNECNRSEVQRLLQKVTENEALHLRQMELEGRLDELQQAEMSRCSNLPKQMEAISQTSTVHSQVPSSNHQFGFKRPLSPSNASEDNLPARKQQEMDPDAQMQLSCPPPDTWQYWAAMRLPAPCGPPELLAGWIQFREEGLKGIPVCGPEWVIDMRDVRGYRQLMSRAPLKQRQNGPFLRDLHEHGLYAILRVILLREYPRLLKETGTSIDPVPRLIPCSFPAPIPGNLPDHDVATLLAERGLSVRDAEDAWQWAYKYMNAEALGSEQTWLATKMRELKAQVVSSAPPGLHTPQEDRYVRTVPSKRRPRSSEQKQSRGVLPRVVGLESSSERLRERNKVGAGGGKVRSAGVCEAPGTKQSKTKAEAEEPRPDWDSWRLYTSAVGVIQSGPPNFLADLGCRVKWERRPQPHPDGEEDLSIITWMKLHHSRGTASAGGMQILTAASIGAHHPHRVEESSIITWMNIHHSRGTASAGGMQLLTALHSFGQRKRVGIKYHMDEVHSRWTQRAHLIHIQNRDHAYKRVDAEGSVATAIQRLVCDCGRTNSTTASACTTKMKLRYLYDALAPRVVAVLLPNPKTDRAVSLCFYHVLFLPLVFVTVRSVGMNDGWWSSFVAFRNAHAVRTASLFLHPVDSTLLPASACTISHVDKVDATISQEKNSWEGVIEQGLIGSLGFFRLHLVFVSLSSLQAFLFAVRFASNSATISVISRLLHRIPTSRTIKQAFRPMDSLPIELRAEIFIHYHQLLSRSDLKQLLFLGSVSSPWRALAWSLKELWTKPHFKLGSSFFLQHLGDHVIDPQTHQMLAWLRRARGTKSLELRISVDQHYYQMARILHRFLPTVSNYLRVLQLELSQPQLAPLFSAEAPTFSHLESLALVVGCLDIPCWPWIDGLTSRAPKLRFLVLDGNHPPCCVDAPIKVDGFLKSFPWAQLIMLHINFFIPVPLWRSIIGQCRSLCSGQFFVRCMDDPLLEIRESYILPSLISLQMRVMPLCYPHLFDNLGFPALQLFAFDAYPYTVPQMLSTGQCSQLLFLKLDVPIFDHDLMVILRSQPNLERLQVYIDQLGAMECRVIWTAHRQNYLQKLKHLSIGFVALHNFYEEQRSDAMHWATQVMAAGWDLSMLGSPTVTDRLSQILQPSFLVYPLPTVETIDMFDGDGRRWTRRFHLCSGISFAITSTSYLTFLSQSYIYHFRLRLVNFSCHVASLDSCSICQHGILQWVNDESPRLSCVRTKQVWCSPAKVSTDHSGTECKARSRFRVGTTGLDTGDPILIKCSNLCRLVLVFHRPHATHHILQVFFPAHTKCFIARLQLRLLHFPMSLADPPMVDCKCKLQSNLIEEVHREADAEATETPTTPPRDVRARIEHQDNPEDIITAVEDAQDILGDLCYLLRTPPANNSRARLEAGLHQLQTLLIHSNTLFQDLDMFHLPKQPGFTARRKDAALRRAASQCDRIDDAFESLAEGNGHPETSHARLSASHFVTVLFLTRAYSSRGLSWLVHLSRSIVKALVGGQWEKEIPHGPSTLTYAICPRCNKTYRPILLGSFPIYSLECNYIDDMGRRCESPLVRLATVDMVIRYIPIKPYVYRDFGDWLGWCLAHPGIEQAMDYSR
ncbi:hypothetical protein C8R43DRAFT_943213 [Mycena crocata]|nr:hypothetical protein C8R43DRAFT_943213 [Mycena crocata]